MKVLATFAVVVWLTLLGQVMLDHSQVWIYFAGFWSVICVYWICAVFGAKRIRIRNYANGGGRGTTSNTI